MKRFAILVLAAAALAAFAPPVFADPPEPGCAVGQMLASTPLCSRAVPPPQPAADPPEAAAAEVATGEVAPRIRNNSISLTGEADGDFSVTHSTIGYSRRLFGGRWGVGFSLSPRSFRAARAGAWQAVREDVGPEISYRVSDHVSLTASFLHGSGERCVLDSLGGCDWRDFGVWTGRLAVDVALPLIPARGIWGHLSVGRQGVWERDPLVGWENRATSIQYGIAYSF